MKTIKTTPQLLSIILSYQRPVMIALKGSGVFIYRCIMESGIYQIVNTIDGKGYIGSAKNLKQREYNHFHLLRLDKHPSKHLQHAFNLYGENVFQFEILEYCEKDKLIDKEQFHIDVYKGNNRELYNIRSIAKNNLGLRFSEESKKKMSLSSKGKPKSEEHKRNIAMGLKGVNTWTTGRKFGALSDERKSKMSHSLKGRVSGTQGKHHSIETKKRMSELAKVRWSNPDYREKITKMQQEHNGFKGKHHTQESKKKMSEARKLYFSNKN